MPYTIVTHSHVNSWITSNETVESAQHTNSFDSVCLYRGNNNDITNDRYLYSIRYVVLNEKSLMVNGDAFYVINNLQSKIVVYGCCISSSSTRSAPAHRRIQMAVGRRGVGWGLELAYANDFYHWVRFFISIHIQYIRCLWRAYADDDMTYDGSLWLVLFMTESEAKRIALTHTPTHTPIGTEHKSLCTDPMTMQLPQLAGCCLLPFAKYFLCRIIWAKFFSICLLFNGTAQRHLYTLVRHQLVSFYDSRWNMTDDCAVRVCASGPNI